MHLKNKGGIDVSVPENHKNYKCSAKIGASSFFAAVLGCFVFELYPLEFIVPGWQTHGGYKCGRH
ncbi:MAG: hypothetical protein PVS3B1_28130 [Ktedonobacteraceae bacterium]